MLSRKFLPSRLEGPLLDLFYIAVAAAGFAVLWGITKACDRV